LGRREKTKDNSMRIDQTAIINAYFAKDPSGKLLANPAHPIFQESRLRERSSWAKQFHEGVIYEVAVGKCGNNPQALQNAVARGQVQIVGQVPSAMYHFPKTSIGGGQTFTNADNASRSKPIDEGDYMSLRDAFLDVVPDEDFCGVDMFDFGTGSSSSGLASGRSPQAASRNRNLCISTKIQKTEKRTSAGDKGIVVLDGEHCLPEFLFVERATFELLKSNHIRTIVCGFMG
jgi:hypothetical protein